jgi:hypothetical protein
VVEQRLADFADDCIIDILRDIDTTDLGTKGAGDR